jgi:malate dehydrogenase
MERKDLLIANAQIFSAQGKALDKVADRRVKVLVVGNPANTNALIARENAKGLDPRNFTAMTRLDHNRAKAQLAGKAGAHVSDVQRAIIWGNHSATQFPDLAHATVNGTPALAHVSQAWYRDEFIPTVQQRGATIIKARGASSAASAASAAIDHVHDWALGTPDDDWVSMAAPSAASGASTRSCRASPSTTSAIARWRPPKPSSVRSAPGSKTCCKPAPRVA